MRAALAAHAHQGFAGLLLRKKVSREKQQESLQAIIESTERLERIIAILVDVAAMEAGRLRIAAAPVQADSLARQAAGHRAESARKHRILAVAPRGLPAIEADVGLVGRALDELLDNAVKFSPDGGTIVVRARSVRDGVEFSVRDRGIGISRDHLATLFDEFVQVDPSATRRFGGLGGGPGVRERVVEAHGGRLEVSSRPGHGSTFTFVLPGRRARPRAATQPPGARAAKRTTAKRTTRRGAKR